MAGAIILNRTFERWSFLKQKKNNYHRVRIAREFQRNGAAAARCGGFRDNKYIFCLQKTKCSLSIHKARLSKKSKQWNLLKLALVRESQGWYVPSQCINAPAGSPGLGGVFTAVSLGVDGSLLDRHQLARAARGVLVGNNTITFSSKVIYHEFECLPCIAIESPHTSTHRRIHAFTHAH